ncbi:MAG TPA: crosslink repair DNA glycosylase YcaQ family protein, partial [Anaerolineales bacterium]|nr:crosslink repair DNA glycosylase YcaQ family protein [Anaerolineales bacterium]
RSILRLRDGVWRRRRDLRVRSPAQARRFVKRVGYCLFWPTHGLEMPNLLQAIAGNGRPLSSGYDDPAIGRSWNWKDEALDKRWWYYGKLIHKRSTLVSLSLLPAFYALSENYGDPQDYLVEYREGRLSAEAKAIYEALLEEGPLDAIRLRQQSRLAGAQAKTRFDRALVELQADLKVLPTGVAEAGAWHYAFVYDLVDRWFPSLPEQARSITVRQARRQILAVHIGHMVAVEPRHLATALGWSAAETAATVRRMIEEGDLVQIEVEPGRPLVTDPRWARRLRPRPGARRGGRRRRAAG